MTLYPAQVDTDITLPKITDLTDPVAGETVNRLRDAVVAVEAELGAKPSGTFTTVRNRLDRIETLLTQQVVTIAGDLGGTPPAPIVIGIQTRPVSSAAPSAGQALTWNGIAWAPADAIQIAQDLGNTAAAPYVIGLQGRPVDSVAPTANQVLTWDGYKWLPTTQTVTLNVLPTVTLLPAELVFLSGDGYNGTSTPMRVGARAVDMANYPSSTLDGRIRTMTFRADLETTNASSTAVAVLKDVTSNAYVTTGTALTVSNATFASPIQITTATAHGYTTGQLVVISGVNGNTVANGVFTITVVNGTQFTLNGTTGNAVYTGGGFVGVPLSTSSLSSVELSATITSGNYAGVMRTDQISMYEVQIYLLNGTITDQVICRNARIYITYSPPANVSSLVALAMPTDISFIAGTELNGFSTPAGMGGRLFDVTKFPALMPDGSGRSRTIEFYVDAEVSAAGVDGYCQLYDTTINAVVTNILFHFTNTTPAEVFSLPLPVGTLPGTIIQDITARYEVQLWKVSNSVTDRVLLNNARLVITYA